MATTTITIQIGTKTRILRYGTMGESYDNVINRLLDDNSLLDRTVSNLTEQISSEHLLAGEFDKDEQHLIFQMLDGPLQSEDDIVKDLAERIEKKLEQLRSR